MLERQGTRRLDPRLHGAMELVSKEGPSTFWFPSTCRDHPYPPRPLFSDHTLDFPDFCDWNCLGCFFPSSGVAETCFHPLFPNVGLDPEQASDFNSLLLLNPGTEFCCVFPFASRVVSGYPFPSGPFALRLFFSAPMATSGTYLPSSGTQSSRFPALLRDDGELPSRVGTLPASWVALSERQKHRAGPGRLHPESRRRRSPWNQTFSP